MTLYQKLKVLKHFGVQKYKDKECSLIFKPEEGKVGEDFKVTEDVTLELSKQEIENEMKEGMDRL